MPDLCDLPECPTCKARAEADALWEQADAKNADDPDGDTWWVGPPIEYEQTCPRCTVDYWQRHNEYEAAQDRSMSLFETQPPANRTNSL